MGTYFDLQEVSELLFQLELESSQFLMDSGSISNSDFQSDESYIKYRALLKSKKVDQDIIPATKVIEGQY